MSYKIFLVESAGSTYAQLEAAALKAHSSRLKSKKSKTSIKQVHKTIALLGENPKHPSLKTHEFSSITNPYDSTQKVFEAYVQNKTPGAFRVFWCYGPEKKQITIIAITPHP